ncbi:bifunctional UDP-N-acetylglucosamine diphosphorylase/glucosamine-1-phosphate N-acetyltransferase GlmU [Schaalia vaccimaxillae]|uniref:bifunctional UDP-N-acetylglucosamine diphosphorylase/glucosamine-1-phosphate N-acetyltransferase GlmU n=1 Tax=Schaalia vaccimaxillae TaxID=183916 RepID=UPI0003B61BF3|nr:NTP transferase domain-containing protein [Schaalia vaccimaxillae]
MTLPAAVIVLAAGQGTRMKSSLPKVVHPVAGLSMIGHALRAADGLSPKHLVAVVRHQRDVVAAEITKVMPHTVIADQDEIPGTGRAVQCGLETLEEQVGQVHGTLVVTYGDVPMLSTTTLAELVAVHEGSNHAVTVLTSRIDDPTGYGRIIRDEAGIVTAIVEQKDATEEQAAVNEINAGIYAFDADFLRESLANVGTANAQGEVYLTDVLAAAAPAGRTAGALELADFWQAQGCNDRVQLAELGAEFNRRICEAHMRQGVSIIDPVSTRIDVDVRIGSDTTILPGSYLTGHTTIGSECEIGPAAILKAAEVGDRTVLPSSWVENASIPADTMVEPFSVIGRA